MCIRKLCFQSSELSNNFKEMLTVLKKKQKKKTFKIAEVSLYVFLSHPANKTFLGAAPNDSSAQ